MKNKKIITKESIADVKRQVSIVDLINDDVGLDEVDNYYVGPSPFLGTRAKSLCVNAEAGRFRCIVTGKYGDSIDYMRQRFRMGFIEAVEALADRYGIEVEYESDRGKAEPIPQYELPMSFIETRRDQRIHQRSA